MTVKPPYQLVVEVSGVCNLRCPQCWIGLRWFDRGKEFHFMSMDLFNRLADEAQGYIKHTYLHLWGEPTLNKHLPEMIRRTRQFSTVDLATHGLFIDEALADVLVECDTLSVSIDGIDQATYEQYRVGGKVETALRGLRMLVAKRQALGKPKVNWTYVVFRNNEGQIPEAQRLADEIGANIGFKPPLFWDRTHMTANMPSDEKHRRYVMVDGEWKLKADRLKCREFWETVYVLPNGNVLTCCYDGAGEYPTGNINGRTLLDVWNGDVYTRMREQHLAGRLNDMCEKYCQLPG